MTTDADLPELPEWMTDSIDAKQAHSALAVEMPSIPDDRAGLYRLPIFGWAWSGDTRQIER